MTRFGRAVVAHGQTFEVREYPVPDPAPHAMVLRQELAGICGTDLHMWQNGIQGEMALGHENVGIIEALGKEVTKDAVGNPLREGDRVIFQPGTPHGAYGFKTNPDVAPHFTGGFGEYMYLAYPDTCVLKTNLPSEVAVLTEPFTVGVHAVMRGRVQLGDTVVVQGSGAIGLVTLVCARMSGAAKIIVVGGPAKRLELARRMGADVTIDVEEIRTPEDRRELVLAETPQKGGAHVVFECAGFLSAIPEGLAYVRRDGAFVEVGNFVDMGPVSLNVNQLMMRRNMRVEAIWGSQGDHFIRGLPLLERNEYPFADMVSHVLPLEDIGKGFEALNGTYRLGDEVVIKIVVQGGE
ncbi:MAG: zinc-binding dehydrogenase [Caldilineaceae bacterium]|nr:zinc-binding dehydrogenase [Caldilineaceae bacterium]